MLLDMELPPFFFTAIDNFVDKYKGQILQEVIFEAKSVSSFMMEKVQKTGAMPHHILQNYHYVKGNDLGLQYGKLEYLCKDDCIMEEKDLYDSKEVYGYYRQDIKQMTEYYNEGFDKRNPIKLMPPKEPLVLFEEGVWRFTKNFKVEYSPYLTMLYGYETPEAFRMAWQYKVTSWNRVFKRYVRGDNITDSNKKAREEAVKSFPQWDHYIKVARKAGAFQKPEEAEEE